MNVYLDTKLTNLIGEDPDLISIALLSERYEELYVTPPFHSAKCTEFVRDVVLPLLNFELHVFVPSGRLRVHILTWLYIVRLGNEEIIVCAYYDGDFDMVKQALDSRVPDWIRFDNIADAVSALLQNCYCELDQLSDGRSVQHHALQDVRALMYAYRPALRG